MIYAEILAGGKGSRMGNTDMPKQFMYIGDKPIIIHTLEIFLLTKRIDKVIIVTPKNWIPHMNDLIKKTVHTELIDKVIVCEGGEDRNSSIMNGIECIRKKFGIKNEDIVITHDAVRPFVTKRIIEENIDMAIKYGATDTVVPAIDTIISSIDGDTISDIPIRNTMYLGQTPQSFNINKLVDIYKSLRDEEKEILTDAAKMFILKKEKVKLVNGEIFNIKITTKYDLSIAKSLLEVGSYDK